MTPNSPFRAISRAILLGLLAGTAPALAQNTQGNGALPQTIPGLDNFSIAPPNRLNPSQTTPTRPTPVPITPLPRATTQPRATIQALPAPTPTRSPVITPRSLAAPAARPTAAPTHAPTPPAAPAPRATPTPAAAPTPASAPLPAILATPSPTPQPVATTTAAPTAPDKRPSPLWIIGLIALLILPGAVVAAYFYRRALRTTGAGYIEDEREEDYAAPATPQPLGPIPSPAHPATAARAQLELAFRPRRAGTNITSAAVDYELIVRNVGQAPARDVRVGLDLLTAGNEHDAQLKALFDAPVDRPIVAPFDLPPGEIKGVKALAMLSKSAVNVVTVKGRPMFVPMIAINALYSWDGGAGQTASSHVVGIERGERERMRPFWLDVTPRMHDGVSERPHAMAVKR